MLEFFIFSNSQAVFSQDSSAKVRRAGFYAWLALQERHQGSEDCSEWDMSALQIVKARCVDRFGLLRPRIKAVQHSVTQHNRTQTQSDPR